MNWLTAWAAAFGLTIPVVVAFYLLKRRRHRVLVSSTLLWKRYLAEQLAGSPFQRLRHHWLLVLQVLLLAFAVLALTRPYLSGSTAPSGLRVLILDASASMQSTDIAPSRFEAARAEARRLVDGARPGESLAILEAGPRTLVRQSATTDRLRLHRALDACTVTDGRAAIADALSLAEGLVREMPDAEIHLFSDGAMENLREFENHPLPLVFHPVGERRHNVAFLSLEVRVHPENPNQRTVFADLANLTPDPLQTTVELEFNNVVIDLRSVSLDPGASLPLLFHIPPTNHGAFHIRHTAADDLTVDNQAYVVSVLPPPVRILLLTRGNRFLERALRLAGPVELEVRSVLTHPTADHDLVVLDNLLPSVWPEIPVLAFQVSAPGWFESTTPWPTPVPVDWQRTHPLLRFVGWDSIQITEALRVPPPHWGEVLVEAIDAPLLVAGEMAGQRRIWVAFDPLNSSWPLRVSFPIFIANAVDWLNPARSKMERLNLRAGDPWRWTPPPGFDGIIEVQPPDSEWRPVPWEDTGSEAVFGGTERAGLYLWRHGSASQTFAVHALDPLESDTLPRRAWNVGRFDNAPPMTLHRIDRELWRWLAAAAFAVLLFEWWYFHRRST